MPFNPSVKVLKIALWTALRTIFFGAKNALDCTIVHIYNLKNYSEVIHPDSRKTASGAWTQKAFPLFLFYETTTGPKPILAEAQLIGL